MSVALGGVSHEKSETSEKVKNNSFTHTKNPDGETNDYCSLSEKVKKDYCSVTKQAKRRLLQRKLKSEK